MSLFLKARTDQLIHLTLSTKPVDKFPFSWLIFWPYMRSWVRFYRKFKVYVCKVQIRNHTEFQTKIKSLTCTKAWNLKCKECVKAMEEWTLRVHTAYSSSTHKKPTTCIFCKHAGNGSKRVICCCTAEVYGTKEVHVILEKTYQPHSRIMQQLNRRALMPFCMHFPWAIVKWFFCQVYTLCSCSNRCPQG